MSNTQNLDDTTKGQLTESIKKIVGYMNMECQVEIREEIDDRGSRAVSISIYTPENARFIIGKNGQNLKSRCLWLWQFWQSSSSSRNLA